MGSGVRIGVTLSNGFLAVFNNHVNNAHARAVRSFRRKFGPGVWAKRMAPFQRRGIMSIFEVGPNRWTKFYVAEVTRFVMEKGRSLG